jgi:hypothetical protein
MAIFLKKMKRFTFILLIAILLNVASALAQSGTTGPLTWKINNGTLTISGEGAMPNYNYNGAPWYEKQFPMMYNGLFVIQFSLR